MLSRVRAEIELENCTRFRFASFADEIFRCSIKRRGGRVVSPRRTDQAGGKVQGRSSSEVSQRYLYVWRNFLAVGEKYNTPIALLEVQLLALKFLVAPGFAQSRGLIDNIEYLNDGTGTTGEVSGTCVAMLRRAFSISYASHIASRSMMQELSCQP